LQNKILLVREAKEIIQGLYGIEKKIYLTSLKYIGEFEDVYFYIEQKLIKKIDIEIVGKIHTGKSSNEYGCNYI